MNQSRMNIFLNLPEIRTHRLTMRKMLPSDSEDMFEYASLDLVTRYLLWTPHITISTTRLLLQSLQREYSKGRHREWALVCNKTNQMIGTCGFTRIDLDNKTAELGYVLNPAYWGQGYAVEAAKELISIAFDYLELERVEIRYMSDNYPSRRVGEKCGMTFEGVLRNSLYVKGGYVNVGVCSILKNEYYQNNQPRDYSHFNQSNKRFMFKF